MVYRHIDFALLQALIIKTTSLAHALKTPIVFPSHPDNDRHSGMPEGNTIGVF